MSPVFSVCCMVTENQQSPQFPSRKQKSPVHAIDGLKCLFCLHTHLIILHTTSRFFFRSFQDKYIFLKIHYIKKNYTFILKREVITIQSSSGIPTFQGHSLNYISIWSAAGDFPPAHSHITLLPFPFFL